MARAPARLMSYTDVSTPTVTMHDTMLPLQLPDLVALTCAHPIQPMACNTPVAIVPAG
jgi:hypothetical protein